MKAKMIYYWAWAGLPTFAILVGTALSALFLALILSLFTTKQKDPYSI